LVNEVSIQKVVAIRRSSDLNLDGRSDVIFQDQASGWAQAWFLGGGSGITIVDASNLTLQNTWRIVALNRDGRSDVVWQDPVSGAAQVWYLGQGAVGLGLKGAAGLSAPSQWRIAGNS
jgi:hypothetical protein